MLTLLFLYVYTIGSCVALIGVTIWAAWKHEHAIQGTFAVGAIMLCGLALSGLASAPLDYKKGIALTVIGELGFSGVMLALHSLIATFYDHR